MHYVYTAIDKIGKRTNGEIEAESTKAAADILRSQSLLPIMVSDQARTSKAKIDVKNVFGKVSLLDKITFIKNLAVMLRSGFPVSRALTVLSEQSTNSTMSAALHDVASQVDAGQTLANSMSRHPKIFPDMFVSMVGVGEVSGNLEQTLLNLSVQLKKDHDLIRKTKGAMIYPSIIMSAMVLVGIVMFTFVLPKLTAMFADFNVELPLLTRIILGMVAFMKSYGLFLLLFLIIAGVAGFFSLKNPAVQKLVDKYVLKIPVIGKIIQYTNLARFCRTLASLTKAGMPILESVKVTQRSLGNLQYKEALTKAEEMVKSGTPMSTALQNYPKLFTPLLLNMMVVGEESGTVDAVLEEVANFYEAEVDQTVSNLSSILEPVLMVVVGIAVAFLAMGLIMPIYSITQSI